MSSLRKLITIAAIATFIPMATTACFGKFELTRKIYAWNQQVDNDKWIQEFAFIVLNFIPVYGLAGAIDALIGNSLEFWTGSNPLVASETRTIYGANGEVAQATYNPDGTVDLIAIDADGASHVLTLLRAGDQLVAQDASGTVVGQTPAPIAH